MRSARILLAAHSSHLQCSNEQIYHRPLWWKMLVKRRASKTDRIAWTTDSRLDVVDQSLESANETQYGHLPTASHQLTKFALAKCHQHNSVAIISALANRLIPMHFFSDSDCCIFHLENDTGSVQMGKLEIDRMYFQAAFRPMPRQLDPIRSLARECVHAREIFDWPIPVQELCATNRLNVIDFVETNWLNDKEQKCFQLTHKYLLKNEPKNQIVKEFRLILSNHCRFNFIVDELSKANACCFDDVIHNLQMAFSVRRASEWTAFNTICVQIYWFD